MNLCPHPSDKSCPLDLACVVCGAPPAVVCNPKVRGHLRECGGTAPERLCFCVCCCQTPRGYRADDERVECTCKVRASDSTPSDLISRALHRRELADKDATIKALADALKGTAWRKRKGFGPCWCPSAEHEHIPENEDDHVPRCAGRRAVLRLAGRLP